MKLANTALPDNIPFFYYHYNRPLPKNCEVDYILKKYAATQFKKVISIKMMDFCFKSDYITFKVYYKTMPCKHEDTSKTKYNGWDLLHIDL